MQPDDFAGTARFVVSRRLGAGGAGIVYEAHDEELGARVALKRIRRLSPEAILRFKKEFRAIEDVEHPNLVGLGELFEDGGHYFFTMEFVDGVDFLSYVRRTAAPISGDVTDSDRTMLDGGGADARPVAALDGVFDESRLRDAFAQLLRGLDALHRAGKVHRDVKPGNVLVTRDDRVVLLDFGLAADAEAPSEEGVVGTPTYMAPEQSLGLAPTAAADLYSAGVVLYRALTGRPPFLRLPEPGEAHEVARPSALAAGVPEDLDVLCMDLLRVSPELRPSAREALRRIGHAEEQDVSLAPAAPRRFVGRDLELATLRDAFDETLRGAGRAIVIRGASGLGKSTLARHFSEIVETEYGAIVLAGRCWERESVPYKAVDGIIDALGRRLARMPASEHQGLFPEGSALLAQVFPALRPFVRSSAPLPADARERRVQLFAAARALFHGLANRFPVVLVVDDLQWSDADGLALLHEVLRGPDEPSLLLVATARNASTTLTGASALDLLPLDRADARALALDVLGGLPELADAIAAESQGHPLFVDTLARSALAAPAARPAAVKLDDALAERVGRLDERARRVVVAACVAAIPLPLEVLAEASTTSIELLPRAVRALQVARLVRTLRERTVEPYHDRVRDAVVAGLSPDVLSSWHLKLARAMEGNAEPEALADHFAAGGEAEKAAHYTELAAERAIRALAFDRAATLLRRLLAREPRSLKLHLRLAEALVAANRGTDAAASFLDAAAVAPTDVAIDLERRAAEQLLTSGHIERGLAVLGPVLEASGLRAPSSRAGVIASLAFGRARLAARGFGYRERTEAEIPVAELRRIDALGVGAGALGMVDTLRGADLHAKHLLAALDAGEPNRLARAIALEASFSAATGTKNHRRTAEASALAIEMGKRSLDPLTLAQAYTAAGVAAFLEGRWLDARDVLATAETMIREQTSGAGVAFALANVSLYSLGALLHCGALAELARRVPPILADAEQRGDRYALVHIRSSISTFARLTKADPVGAREEAAAALAAWTPTGTQMPHFFDVLAQAQIDLYEGDAERAYDRTSRAFVALRRAMLMRVQFVRVKMLELRARSALATGRLRELERDVASLEREGAPWAVALARLLVASARGAGFAEAARGFDRLGMGLHASVARLRAGEVDGIAGVTDARRFGAMLSPGT